MLRARFKRDAGANANAGSIQYFDRCIEDVADTAFSDDEARLRRIRLYLPAQPEHLNVDRAIVDFVVKHAACLEELVARENPLRSSEQCGEQVELAVRQLNAPSVTVVEAPRSQIEFELGKPVRAMLVLARLHHGRTLGPS